MTKKNPNQRKVLFVDRELQNKFILNFCLLVVFGAALMAVCLYLLTMRTSTVSFENTRATVKTTASFLLPLLVQTFVIGSGLAALGCAAAVLFLTHKIAGPLYRFKKQIRVIESGQLGVDFKIRSRDQLQDVALALNNMAGALKARFVELKKDFRDLGALLERDKNILSDEIKDKAAAVNRALEYFKL